MDINHLESFQAVIAAGRTALGACITTHDAAISELAGDAGLDFTWIDMEHSPMTIVDAMHHVMAVRGTGCAPFIRVPSNHEQVLKPVLELAPAGVIIPMVNTADDARAAVRACRYPADGGGRGFATRRSTRYGRRPLDEYLEHSRREPLVIVQIEHREAVRNIDRILEVPGIGSICIGPFDLSASYGKTARFDDPEVADAIDLVRERTLKAGVMLGGFCCGPFWKDRFMHWKTLTVDFSLIHDGLRRLMALNGRSGGPAGPPRETTHPNN